MDCNNQKFWMLAAKEQFDLNGSDNCAWDDNRRVLRLASRRKIVDLPIDRSAAGNLADGPPMTLDVYNTWATVNTSRDEIIAAGAFDEPVSIFRAPSGQQILDLSMTDDDVLYCITGVAGISGSVVILDRRNRWTQSPFIETSFIPDRICALPDGSALVLDRSNKKLMKLIGRPLPYRPHIDYQPGTGRPCQENPDPPQLIALDDNIIPNDSRVIAMDAGRDGSVALLLWPDAETTRSELLIISEDGTWQNRVKLDPAGIPFSVGQVAPHRWALLYENCQEALVYKVSPDKTNSKIKTIYPSGDRYPLTAWPNQPFCNALCLPVCYPGMDKDVLRPRPLHHLSLPNLAATGEVNSEETIDSGTYDNVWHRLYLEACIPGGSSISVFLRVANSRKELQSAPEMEHCFGSFAGDQLGGDIPHGTWVSESSELPFHKGLLDYPSKENESGLFTCLIQRPGLQVRTLAGRYLSIRLVLKGNNHAGPQIAALRIYNPRFSYLDNYLPDLFKENIFGPDADITSPATGADFLQRYLCLFEGILTPMEDKVAASWMITDPDNAPTEALDWLAGWIGLSLSPGMDEKRKRLMIKHATSLYRQRGTLAGLAGALNIATGNMVSDGQIIILEDFRLRRVFATILGADLEEEEHPLLAGMVSSGNSYVGDTLFLGDEEKKEFLALFRPEAAVSGDEKKAVSDLYESTANRITILVHQDMDEEMLGLIRRIAEMEIPAHVLLRILPSSKPLLIGLSALVGVDTWLGSHTPPEPVKVGASYLGSGDFILTTGSLDPRIEGSAVTDLHPGQKRPMAEAGDTLYPEYGSSFTLSASESKAYNGREIDRYIWELLK